MADKPQVEGLKSAADFAKQLISLSTGVVTITVTFLDKFTPPVGNTKKVPWLLEAAWAGYGITILFGCLTLMAITGTLTLVDRQANGQQLTDADKASIDAYGTNIKTPATGMIISFLLSLALTILAGRSIF